MVCVGNILNGTVYQVFHQACPGVEPEHVMMPAPGHEFPTPFEFQAEGRGIMGPEYRVKAPGQAGSADLAAYGLASGPLSPLSRQCNPVPGEDLLGGFGFRRVEPELNGKIAPVGSRIE